MKAQGELEQIECIYRYKIYIESYIGFLSIERILLEKKHFY